MSGVLCSLAAELSQAINKTINNSIKVEASELHQEIETILETEINQKKEETIGEDKDPPHGILPGMGRYKTCKRK